MSQFLRSLKRDWPRLVTELVVVVAGITISFALDQWRRDREDRREERRNWSAIAENLSADSLYLARRIAQLERMTKAYSGLLSGGPADSLDSYMDQAISYALFTPTQTAYNELQQMAGSRILRNRALLNNLTNAYTREYVRAAEWDGINRDFVLQRFIPYVDMNAPDTENVGGGETVTGLASVYHALAKRDQFRNLVRTNRMFKDAQLSVYKAALKRVEGLQQLIARELTPATSTA